MNGSDRSVLISTCRETHIGKPLFIVLQLYDSLPTLLICMVNELTECQATGELSVITRCFLVMPAYKNKTAACACRAGPRDIGAAKTPSRFHEARLPSGADWRDAPKQAPGQGQDAAAHRAAAPVRTEAAAVAGQLAHSAAGAAVEVSKTVTLVEQQRPGEAAGAALRYLLVVVGC